MIADSFFNETYDVTVRLKVLSFKKEESKIEKAMKAYGYFDNIISDNVNGSKAFVCGTWQDVTIFFDIDEFKEKGKANKIEAIKTLQHECQHVRQLILDKIEEDVQGKTDTECYLRISDWIFKKCMNTKYFKKLIK